MVYDYNAPIKLFIENSQITESGNKKGEALLLPTTRQDFAEMLQKIGVNYDMNYARFTITECYIDNDNGVYSLPKTAHIEELNHLAKILTNYDEEKLDTFFAVLEITQYPDMKTIINIADNIDCYYLQPVYTMEQ